MPLREDEEGRSPLQGGTKGYLRAECTLGASLEAAEPAELGSRSWQRGSRVHTQDGDSRYTHRTEH